MKVIFDNNLSPHMARALNLLLQHYADEGKEYLVTSVKEHFGRGNIPDVELLTRLGQEGGWVFISGDNNIRRRPHELKAFQDAKLIGVFCTAKVKGWPVTKQMAHLLNLWSVLEAKVKKAKPGTMFSIDTQNDIKPL